MIEKNDMEEIKQTILALKRQNRRLNFGLYLLLGLMITTVSAIVLTEKTNAGSSISPDSVLRVRGLIVVDQNKRERIRIGAPLPDPLLQGKRLERNGSISGILLMDGEGTERLFHFGRAGNGRAHSGHDSRADGDVSRQRRDGREFSASRFR